MKDDQRRITLEVPIDSGQRVAFISSADNRTGGVKLGQLVKEGTIPYVTSPLDKRVKLFKRADLDVLRSAPRPPQAAGAPARSE